MRAIFRADASNTLGSGHIMRCLALAGSLRAMGWDCAFAVRAGSLESAPALADAGYEILLIEGTAEQEAETLARHWPDGCDWLIVDHYGRDRRFETACRSWAQHTLVIDDLADRPHDADLLLDQTLDRAAQAYAGLVPPGCRLVLGTRYALLRPEFARLRPAALGKRHAGGKLRLLVSLGGTDPDNVTSAVLAAIAESGLALTADVVVGGGCRWLKEIDERVAALPGVRLHVNPANLAELMAAADLAVGAAGTSSWERCCLGLPTVMLVLADNQQENARRLAAAGAVRCVSGSGGALTAAICTTLQEIAGDSALLEEMATRAAALCDGQGSLRARLFLLPPRPTKDRLGVTLRHAEPADEATLLYWQQLPSIRSLARNPRIPTPEEHHAWFEAKMRSDKSFITMIEHGGTEAGMLRLDRIAGHDSAPAYEVSIVVDERHRGVGVGLGALQQVRLWMPEAELHAETMPGNTPSQTLFCAAGYRQVAHNQLFCPAAR